VGICYIFPNLVCLDQEKSGNPAGKASFLKITKSIPHFGQIFFTVKAMHKV
jgi:hypothetical protein